MMPGPQGGMSGSMPSSMSGSMPISHGGMTDMFGMHPHQPPGSDMDAHELSSAETSMGRKSKRRNRRRRFKRTHSLMSCSSDGRSRPSRHDSDRKKRQHKHGRRQSHRGRTGYEQKTATKQSQRSGRGRSTHKDHKHKRHGHDSSDYSAYSSDSGGQLSDGEHDFPLNCKRLGGVWQHTLEPSYVKTVYPDKSKLKIMKACPGEAPQVLMESLQAGAMTPEVIDQVIFILTNKGPNTRLNRFLHLGTDKDRKRKHFRDALVKEATRSGKAMKPKPPATRLELVHVMAQEQGP